MACLSRKYLTKKEPGTENTAKTNSAMYNALMYGTRSDLAELLSATDNEADKIPVLYFMRAEA